MGRIIFCANIQFTNFERLHGISKTISRINNLLFFNNNTKKVGEKWIVRLLTTFTLVGKC